MVHIFLFLFAKSQNPCSNSILQNAGQVFHASSSSYILIAYILIACEISQHQGLKLT
jgi:hypothetical protein